ncbi:MAG: hypothetical protein ACOX3T_01520 [Bdellovibrionota bacterium]
MENSRKLLSYLLQAITHKIRTPLATIQNDVEYCSHIIKNDELTQINNSVKNSINKINLIVDNAIFMINNQENKEINKKENFLISELKTLSFIELENGQEFNKLVFLNKNDFFNYFTLLYSVFKSLNLFLDEKCNLKIRLEKKEDKFTLNSSFKAIERVSEKNNLKDQAEFNSLFEYINVKNNIDSIDAILSDILLNDLGLTIKLTSKKNLIHFTIKGF